MQKINEFIVWLWKPARRFFGFGLLLAELLLTGALCVWLFAGYIGEVSICVALAQDLAQCALYTLFTVGIVTLIMQSVYWKEIRE